MIYIVGGTRPNFIKIAPIARVFNKYKINYYLNNKKEREMIAQQGMKFTRKNLNNTIRVKQMIEITYDKFGGKIK